MVVGNVCNCDNLPIDSGKDVNWFSCTCNVCNCDNWPIDSGNDVNCKLPDKLLDKYNVCNCDNWPIDSGKDVNRLKLIFIISNRDKWPIESGIHRGQGSLFLRY